MPRFHMHTLGCKVNRAESETIAAALLDAGWEPSEAEQADVAIVNTCTVTGEADHKNRKLIRSLLRAGAKNVLVTGCAVNINPDFYADISPRVRVEGNKQRVPQTAARLVESAPSPLADIQADVEAQLRSLARSGSGFRTRVDVKIQDGCGNACTYCIVHVARGKARSTSAEQVIEEVQRIAASGTKEVVLVGIDLAAYRSEGLDLAGLLAALQRETGIGRIRLSSVEPQSLTPELGDILASSQGRVCRHLHLCLQSGSSKVLHEMARHYDAEEFCDLVGKLRAKVPELALSTDVIVGFPGETDDDFAQTCEVVQRCGFMRLHVFRYSKRPGTPAAAREDQVDPQVMAARAARLRDLGTKLALRDMQARVGTTERVIVERPGMGTSESYHKVFFDENLPQGALIPMQFSDIDERQQALRAKLP